MQCYLIWHQSSKTIDQKLLRKERKSCQLTFHSDLNNFRELTNKKQFQNEQVRQKGKLLKWLVAVWKTMGGGRGYIALPHSQINCPQILSNRLLIFSGHKCQRPTKKVSREREQLKRGQEGKELATSTKSINKNHALKSNLNQRSSLTGYESNEEGCLVSATTVYAQT